MSLPQGLLERKQKIRMGNQNWRRELYEERNSWVISQQRRRKTQQQLNYRIQTINRGKMQSNLWYKSPWRQQQSLWFRRGDDTVLLCASLFSPAFPEADQKNRERAAGLALTIPLCSRGTVNPNRELLLLDEQSKGSQLLGKASPTDKQVFLNIDLFLNILRKRDWNKKTNQKNGNREREELKVTYRNNLYWTKLKGKWPP